MKRLLGRYAHYLLACLALVGATIALVAVLLPDQKTEQPVAKVSTLRIECQGSDQFECYSNYFKSKSSTEGTKAAVADLRQMYDQGDGYVRSQCHQLAHVIGHAGYDKYGSLSAAYAQGDTFCWSGYYHGVTEDAVDTMGAERIRSEANNICSELAQKEQYSFDHYNCVHGLGHGFMSVEDYNLFKALNTCDLLVDDWERTSCYGGVFMENVMVAVRGPGKSDYLKADQLMYPCTAVEKPYKQACYQMQTSYILQQNGYDFAKTFTLCRDDADVGFADTCYQSIGRDASGSTTSDIQQTKAKCDLAPDTNGLENCMLGAVRDFVSYHHSDVQAKQFCEVFASSIKQRCLDEVTTYYRSF